MSFDRLFEEFHELEIHPNSNYGITVGLEKEDSYKDWKVTMSGPKDTCYKGGLFVLNVHFPDNYPNEPPEVCFITPIYHLNVNPKAPEKEEDGFHKLGNVCISTLNWWKPEYKIKEVLLNIYFQNPDSAYGSDRSKEYKEFDGCMFYEKAHFFTKKYATSLYYNENYDRTQDWDFNI